MPTPIRCEPQLFDKDMTGQVIIITGANSGCGLETTRQLAKQGATVILACRNEVKAKAAMDDIGYADNTVFIQLDLADLSSVRSFVNSFTVAYDRLDVLVNNAGIMACPYSKTKDGFEVQIGCNHLAHFLLFKMLAPLLIKTAEDTGKPSRFVSLSSCAASEVSIGSTGYADIYFDDMNWESKEYSTGMAYQQSKLANYLTAWEASKMYSSSKLICASVHPGWVRSNLDQHVLSSSFFANMMRNVFEWSGHMISAVDGAQTTLHCVLNDAADMDSGAFYSQFGIYKAKDAKKGGWPMKLPNPNATPEASTKLWKASEKLVGA